MRQLVQVLERLLAVRPALSIRRDPSDRSRKQGKMTLTKGTSITEAIQIAKKRTLISRVPVVAVAIIIAGIGWRTWKAGGGWGQYVGVGLVVLAVADSARLFWQERRDPALGAFSGGIFRFYWISGRSVEVPLSRVRWVKVHDNPYWQFRRVYPKWFELEIEGEPGGIIVPASNLKPEARDILTRMSRSKR